MQIYKKRFALLFIGLLLLSGCVQWKKFAYEGIGRDGWQQPERVVESLQIDMGNRVADLGSGSGYFTFRLADAVGSEGMVYAVDVDSAMNAYLKNITDKREYDNVEVVLAENHDPLIPTPVDLIFTSNTYHHIEDRSNYLNNVKKYLEPGGRVAILDYNGTRWKTKLFGHNHWTVRDTIISEMTAAGFTLVGDYDFVKRQSFLIFSSEPQVP